MRLAAGIVAVVLAWLKPIKPTLDFDVDATYSRQILDGLNPYDLGVVPRPPTAWVLQLPLAWADTVLVSRLLGAGAFFAVGWLTWKLSGLERMWLPPIVAVVELSAGATMMVEAGNMGSLIAILFVVAWWKRSGVAVGLAAGLRLYPMIFALPVRRWRAVILTLAGLMVAGLALVPDLGISDVLDNGGLFVDHSGNGSAVQRIGLPLTLVLGAVLGWWSTRVGFDQGMSVAAVAAVLVPAISWPGYHLILFPAVAWACVHGRWWALAAVPLWFGVGSFGLGDSFFVAALVVLSAIGKAPRPVGAEGRSELELERHGSPHHY